MFYAILISTGFLAGTLAGLLGIGGGAVFIPISILYFIDYLNYPPEFIKILIATSSAIIIINSLSSIYGHYKNGSLHLKLWPYFFVSTIIGAQIGGRITLTISPILIQKILGYLLLIAAVKMIFQKISSDKEVELSDKKLLILTVSSIFISIISTILGVGGGLFMIPLLYFGMEISIKKLSGTSSLFTFFTSLQATIFFILQKPEIDKPYQFGMVNLQIAVFVIIGGILGAQLGVLICKKISKKAIKYIFIITIIAGGIKLSSIYKYLIF